MKLTYAVILYEGPNNWGARSPDMPGCISTGSDIHDLRAIIREAIKCHLEGMAADGDPIPWPKLTTPEQAFAAETAFAAELVAENPDDPTDEEEGWSPPIAEMIEVEVNIPQTTNR